MKSSAEAQRPQISVATIVVWVVALANISLIWLSWTSWFSGTAQHAGMADKLFGQARFGGFRADIVWLFSSSGVLFLAGWFFILKSRKGGYARISAGLCLAEIFSFVLYVWHLITSGMLYFG